MSTLKASRTVETLTVGVVSGIVGGAAEIGWIGLYGAAAGIPLNPVARGIVESMIPALATSTWAAEFGVLIHLGLAIALGIGLALIIPVVLRRLKTRDSESALAMLFLTVVWAVNFLVVLPRINPAFVHLLPYSVTLVSKLLFGFAAATVLRAHRTQQVPIAFPRSG